MKAGPLTLTVCASLVLAAHTTAPFKCVFVFYEACFDMLHRINKFVYLFTTQSK